MAKVGYDKLSSVDKGLQFKSPSGLTVETTGRSEPMYGDGELYRHEVVIVSQDPKKGEKFFAALSTYRSIRSWSWD